MDDVPSVSDLASELVRRGERLVEGSETIGGDGHGPVPAFIFITAAAAACDLYRITLSLWERDDAQQPESSLPGFLHQLTLADQLVSIASRNDLATPDSAEYGRRVWQAFLQTSSDAARLVGELAVTHHAPPEPGPDAGSRMLAPGWEAIGEPLHALPSATVPAERAMLERIALDLARSYEAWMERLGFIYAEAADGNVDFIAVDRARWTPTPLPEPSDDPPAADVPLVWWSDSRETSAGLARHDGRLDPRFIDGSLRRMLRGWMAAGRGDTSLLSSLTSDSILAEATEPAAEEFGSRIPLHDVHWLDITVTTVFPNSAFPSSDLQLRVNITAEAADDRPAPDVSGFVTAPLRFIMEWTLKPDTADPGAWRLCAAQVVTEAATAVSPYHVRRETADEYRDRLGLSPETTVTVGPRKQPPYLYEISCSYFDDDLRTGGSVSTHLERDTVPSRAQAESILEPLALEDLRRKANTDYVRPALDRVETRELLEGRADSSSQPTGPSGYGSPMTPTEPDTDDRASLTEGLGRALRQPWKLTEAAVLATDAFAERYAASRGLEYHATGDTPRNTWRLTKLYAPKSHSFMHGPLGGGSNGLLFYGAQRVGAGNNAGWRRSTFAFYELASMAGLGGGLACVPYSPPSLGGHVKWVSQLPTALTRVPIDSGPFDAQHEVGTTGAVDPVRLREIFSDDFVAWMQTLATGDREALRVEICTGGLCVYVWQTLNSTEALDAFAASAGRIFEQVSAA